MDEIVETVQSLDMDSLSADMIDNGREFFDHMYECMKNISNAFDTLENKKE